MYLPRHENENQVVLRDNHSEQIVAVCPNKEVALRVATLLNFARNFQESPEEIKNDLSANLMSLMQHAEATINLLDNLIGRFPEITEDNPYTKIDLESYKKIIARFKGL